MIEIDELAKSYNDEPVLRDISLKIKEGEKVSVIGPSGCGKTTLVRIILNLVKAGKGTITIDGIRMGNSTATDLRKKIGYVIQKGGLFPHMTGFQNVTLLTDYLGWDRDRSQKRVRNLSELLKVKRDWLMRKPSDLSGGQIQRISLMRALMTDPPILILDEPLGSVDPMIRYELQNDLKSVFKKLNKTVLLITHDLPEAVYLSERIILMRSGRIEQQGTLEQLRDEPQSHFVSEFINAQRGLSEAENA